jgi:hypothetical protein
MIAAIIARLLAEVPALKLIEGVAGFQRATETNPAATPAAYVFTVDESGAELDIDVSDGQDQLVQVTIAIVLVVRNVADATGAAAEVDMDTLRKQVRAALLGWSSGPDYELLTRRQSALSAFRDGHMWWQETWMTAYFDEGA